jgi:hypothetical protein
MYTSDKASGAAAMRANIGNGVRCTRRANGKLVTAGRLVTARRSVELSGQHSELLEQPGEIVAVQFPGKLAASDAHDQRPVPAHVSACGDTQAGVWWLAYRTVTVGRLSLVGSASATPSIDWWVRVGCSSCVANRESASRRLEYVVGRASGCRVARAAGSPSEVALADAGLHQLCAPVLDLRQRLPAPQRGAGRSG